MPCAKKRCAADRFRLLLEHIDKELADGLALHFRIADAPPMRAQKSARSRRHGLGECCSDRGRESRPASDSPFRINPWSTYTQCQAVSDRFVDQHRRHRRIHAARQTRRSLSHRQPARTNSRDRFVLERGHGPIAFEAGDAMREVAEQACRRPACAPLPGETSSNRSGASSFNSDRKRRVLAGRRSPQSPIRQFLSRDRRGSSTPDSAGPHSTRLQTAVSFFLISTSARPNSRACPPSTTPPSCTCMVCCP